MTTGSPSPSLPTRLLAWGQAHPTSAFGLLLALALILTHPGIFFGTNALFFRDYGVLGYGFVHHYRESILSGELPLWNPYSDCGAPFLAQWGTMVLYPFSLLMVIFPMPWALGFFCLLHFWIGGMGMRKLAIDLKLGQFAAALAGVLYIFNGATLSGLMWPNYAVVLGWLPWVLWSLRHAWTSGGRWVLGAAVIGTLQMLSGVPEVILFTWFIALVWMLADWWSNDRSIKLFGRFAGVILLVSGLSAAQLLPFFQTLDLSYRTAGFSTNNWSIPLWGWVNLFVPMIRQIMTYQGTFFQQGQEFISTYYCGATVLVLALLGAFRSERKLRWLWAGVTLLGLVLAMGGNLPGYETLRANIPVWSLIRFPVKFLYLALPALILLAAFGWQATATGRAGEWLRDHKKFRMILGSVAALMLLAVGIAYAFKSNYDNWPVIRSNTLLRFFAFAGAMVLLRFILLEADAARRRGMQLAVLALLIGDACLHYPKLNPTLPARVFEANAIREHQKFPTITPNNFYRVFITPNAEDVLLRSTIPEFEQEFFGRRLALWSNLNLLDEMPKVNGSSTLPLKWQKEVEDKIYSMTNNPPAPLIDFLGARFETSPKSAVEWTPRTNTMPLVTAGQAVRFGDEREVMKQITSPDFKPRQDVWIAAASGSRQWPEPVEAKVRDLIIRPHEIMFTVEAPADTVAVIAQSWHPAWRAEVDGRDISSRIHRANHAFQAVEVPRGMTKVRLSYHDRSYLLGRTLSLMTIIFMICRCFPLRLKSHPENPTPTI